MADAVKDELLSLCWDEVFEIRTIASSLANSGSEASCLETGGSSLADAADDRPFPCMMLMSSAAASALALRSSKCRLVFGILVDVRNFSCALDK